jgi:uncharacterized protein (DUF169 family)
MKMGKDKEWVNYAKILKELLLLEYSPVGLSRLKSPLLPAAEKKLRICRAILDAGKGQTLRIDKKTNACFGASWHLGFRKFSNPEISRMVRKFVVEGEKLFSSYQALDTLLNQMEESPDNSDVYFVLEPLEKCESTPELVIFISDALATCRLLTLVTFIDGLMPKIKIGGPTCRMAIIYPLLTGEVNLSFYDYTARKICNLDKDKLIITVPYPKIPRIMESIGKCSAGTAKIEFAPEFRAFLQKDLAVTD